jgi:hypothetical protein
VRNGVLFPPFIVARTKDACKFAGKKFSVRLPGKPVRGEMGSRPWTPESSRGHRHAERCSRAAVPDHR